jgi:hypothetical protein
MEKNKSKYKSVGEWRRAKPNDYGSAQRQGLVAFICEYYGWKINKPKGYWNIKENVMAEAIKYETRGEWKINSSGSYNSAWDNKWIDECSAHMIELKKPSGHWDIKENVLAEAIKYETRNEWNKNSSASYQYAWKNGWIDECSGHMVEIKKPSGHWNIKENVMADAKKYKTKKGWQINSSGSYKSACKNGWIDECSAHMIGLNKPKGYWNIKENVMAEAKKYNTKKEWKKNSRGSYNSSKKNGWIDECSAHMIEARKPRGYWNIKENVMADAKKYNTKKEWDKNSSASYRNASKNGWIDEFSAHMVEIKKPSGYWNIKENVMAEAIKYETRGEWSKNSMSSYRNARKNGWDDECAKHMK